MPPVELWLPTTPFEAIACDYFLFQGYYYFVAADDLSDWSDQSHIKSRTKEAGSSGLCRALRTLFATFVVPVEISSDGGPELQECAIKYHLHIFLLPMAELSLQLRQ